MRETALREFFEGKVTAAELARDVAGSTTCTSQTTTLVSIEDMDKEFVVSADMAVSLCDAVLRGDLPREALKTVGFALSASDKFCWDADGEEVLANVIADWSCPGINYSLNLENVERFRAWLTRSEPYPVKPALAKSGSNIISVTEKKPTRR
jgi:hypothetical protein